MRKRLLSGGLAIVFALGLSGCWNYYSLDQMSIVVGIAADFNAEKNLFDLSYEVADVANMDQESGVQGRITRAQGKTLFEAARNAKRKEADKLFFGSSNVLVLDRELASKEGILRVIEWFLRDGECRETMSVAISREGTAGEMLEGADERGGIVSSTLHDILSEDKEVTGSTQHLQLYQIYNALHSARKSAALPALRLAQNGDEMVPEVYGSAVIKEDKLIGFLSPEQSRYMLMIENQLKSAILTLAMGDAPAEEVALEIFSCKSNKSYTCREDAIAVEIEISIEAAVAENRSNMDMMDKQAIQRIETAAAEMVEGNVEGLMAVLQHKFNADLLGFGEMIYKHDLPRWNQLAPSWDTLFPDVEVEVSAEITIINSAFTQ